MGICNGLLNETGIEGFRCLWGIRIWWNDVTGKPSIVDLTAVILCIPGRPGVYIFVNALLFAYGKISQNGHWGSTVSVIQT